MPTWIETPHEEFFNRLLTFEADKGQTHGTEPERDVLEWRTVAGHPVARIEYTPRFERKAFYLNQEYFK